MNFKIRQISENVFSFECQRQCIMSLSIQCIFECWIVLEYVNCHTCKMYHMFKINRTDEWIDEKINNWNCRDEWMIYSSDDPIMTLIIFCCKWIKIDNRNSVKINWVRVTL